MIEETIVIEAPVTHHDSAPVAEPKKKKASKPKAKAKPKAAANKKAAEKATRKKKDGLRLPQIRTLKALNASNNPMTIGDISKKAGISVPVVTRAVGTLDPKLRDAHDKANGFKSILSLKYAKVVEGEDCTGIQITAAGSKAIEAALEGFKMPKVHAAPWSVNG